LNVVFKIFKQSVKTHFKFFVFYVHKQWRSQDYYKVWAKKNQHICWGLHKKLQTDNKKNLKKLPNLYKKFREIYIKNCKKFDRKPGRVPGVNRPCPQAYAITNMWVFPSCPTSERSCLGKYSF